MNTVDTLLTELHAVPRDAETLALVARSAPVLYFDAREPFLPLAAGYSIFTEDGPSPSFKRLIELRPEEKPPAAMAIEYAIWWDWDIHHLYELEHVWVYLDAANQPVRVEGSWHGKCYEHPLRLEGGRAVLLSEPGKHAFAPDPSWFHERLRDFQRPDTRSVSAQAGVLVNDLFTGQIRQRVFDRVLARSYLTQQAFDPDWRFTQRFQFAPDALVPWPVLAAWIPRRVTGILEHLEANTPPSAYRALRLVSGEGTTTGLQAAADSGADAVHLPVMFQQNRLVLGNGSAEPLGLEDTYRFLYRQPMGTVLELYGGQALDPLAWFVRTKQFNELTIVLSSDASMLARYNAYVPGGITAIQVESPDEDALALAEQSRSTFVYPRWSRLPGAPPLNPDWVARIHAAGLGVIGGPVDGEERFADLQRKGLDIVWQSAAGRPAAGKPKASG